jgi:predicted dehydrogenase
MIHVAVIGYGRVGAAHAAHYASLPGVRVTAIADLSPPRRHLAAIAHPAAHIAASFDQLAKPPDLVLICTPPTSHEPLIETALRRGAHVFCEKPVFLDPARGERLVALAASSGRIIYPGHNYVFSPMLRRLREYARGGALGEIRHVRIHIARTGPANGTTEWHPGWRTDIVHSGGGVLTDHGPHCIYLTEWLTGQHITATKHTIDTTPIDHHADLTLSLTAGVTASITMSWRAHRRTSIYQLVGSIAEAQLRDNLLVAPGDARRAHGVHETPATSHAHDDWIPALAQDVIASLAQPDRLHRLTAPSLTVARVLASRSGDVLFNHRGQGVGTNGAQFSGSDRSRSP